jgi:hypothetical protein
MERLQAAEQCLLGDTGLVRPDQRLSSVVLGCGSGRGGKQSSVVVYEDVYLHRRPSHALTCWHWHLKARREITDAYPADEERARGRMLSQS